MTRPEALEALWRWILDAWQGGWGLDLDGSDLEMEALRLGLLRRVPYDPVAHEGIDAEPGDEIHVPVRAEEGLDARP